MDNQEKTKVSLTFTADSDIANRIKELANSDGRSLSSYINRVLKEHVERASKKQRSAA